MHIIQYKNMYNCYFFLSILLKLILGTVVVHDRRDRKNDSLHEHNKPLGDVYRFWDLSNSTSITDVCI